MTHLPQVVNTVYTMNNLSSRGHGRLLPQHLPRHLDILKLEPILPLLKAVYTSSEELTL